MLDRVELARFKSDLGVCDLNLRIGARWNIY